MSVKGNDPTPAITIDSVWAEWRPRVLWTFAAGVIACTVGAFIESAVGLYIWAQHHGLAGWQAYLAPTMVDVVTLAGEIVTALAVLENWPKRVRWAGILATLGGLAVSVAANIGRDGWRQPVANMATFAVAPVAMFVMTGLGFMIAKRLLHPALPEPDSGVPGAYPELSEDARRAVVMFRLELADGKVPGVGKIREALGVGQAKAQPVRDELTALLPLAGLLAGTHEAAASAAGERGAA